MVGFTQMSSIMEVTSIMSFLNTFYTAVDALVEKHSLHKVGPGVLHTALCQPHISCAFPVLTYPCLFAGLMSRLP